MGPAMVFFFVLAGAAAMLFIGAIITALIYRFKKGLYGGTWVSWIYGGILCLFAALIVLCYHVSGIKVTRK